MSVANRRMRILTVSDVVESSLYPRIDRRRFAPLDLILACGDLPPEYLASLRNALEVPLYYVKGNHDIRYLLQPPEGCHDLHGRLVFFRGMKVLGLEGSRWYNGGPYQYTEAEMKKIIRRLRPTLWWRGGVDIVITHAPPRGIHDGQDLCHQGFAVYRWLIDKYRPRYFIHGHIHRPEISGEERLTAVGQTRVVNTYGYHIIEIPDSGAAA